MSELSHSPTRAPEAQGSPLSRPHGDSISSAGGSPTTQLQQESVYTSSHNPIVMGGMESMDGIILSQAPQFGHVEPQSAQRVSWTNAEAAGATGPPEALIIQTDLPEPRQFKYNPLLRRSTVMTNSTAVSTTLQRALSEYSNGFIRHVKRVIKRYTMPTNASQNPSPIIETRPSTADSMRGSWIHDEHAPQAMMAAPPMPGEFLCIDQLVAQHGTCMENSFEHSTKNCLCRAAAEVKFSDWMSDTDCCLSPEAQQLVMQPLQASPADCMKTDVFGNTLLHLLTAHDADHMHILQIVGSGSVDCRLKNSAGQSFLHLLQPTWLHDETHGVGPLKTLLSVFHRDTSFFLARDVYGQTFLHSLRSKIEEPTAFIQILRDFDVDLFRDAFGSAPKASDRTRIEPIRRAFTAVITEDMPPPLTSPTSHFPSDIISSQARLLELVTRAQQDPNIEDVYGRNGLHCLAAAVLSDITLLRKTGQATDEAAPQGRKRKRGETDACKERLNLRENICHNLIAAGVNVNHYDKDGNTVLMAFVAQLPEDDDYKVPVSILQMLITSGADIHARNCRGETALHIAVRRGRKLAMRTLVQNGGNVHVRDANGRSLLDLADEKMRGDADNKAYMHYEACRAWLSGQGRAVQDPSVVQEWASRPVG